MTFDDILKDLRERKEMLLEIGDNYHAAQVGKAISFLAGANISLKMDKENVRRNKT